MNILKYNDYEGSAELDMTRGVCRGKILFIDDLITYESDTPALLQKEFEAAVDDYLETCKVLGRAAKKPLKGMFNVRMPAVTHKALTLRALEEEVSLNDVVVRACDAYICVHSEVNQTVHLTVNLPETPMKTMVSSANTKPNWEQVYVQ